MNVFECDRDRGGHDSCIPIPVMYWPRTSDRRASLFWWLSFSVASYHSMRGLNLHRLFSSRHNKRTCLVNHCPLSKRSLTRDLALRSPNPVPAFLASGCDSCCKKRNRNQTWNRLSDSASLLLC